MTEKRIVITDPATALIMIPEYAWNLACLWLYCAFTRPVIHVQWLLIPVFDIVFLLFAKLARLKVVYTVHNSLPHDGDTRKNRLLYGTVYRLVDHLIFHSQSNRDDFRALFPTCQTAHSIIPFGLPHEDIPPRDRTEVRKRLCWAEDEVVILFLGHIRPYKGLDLLLRAIAELEDRDEVTSVDRTVDMACAIDLLVLPYRTATTSFIGMVALRYGTPMLATARGTFPEMLGEELSEWIVPPDDVPALRDALTRFVHTTHEQREAIRNVLLKNAQSKYAWSGIGERTISVYDGLS